MELSEYLRVLKSSWITILAFTLAGLAVAAGALLLQPVTYVATAKTYVSISSARDVNTASQGSGFAKALAADLATIATTPYVLDRVREDLRLNTTSAALANQVDAIVASDGAVVEVSATTAQPKLSAALANAVVVELSTAAAQLNPNAGNAASVARTTTVGQAAVPSSPASPTIPLNLVVGILSGFALGVLVVLARQVLDQRLRSAGQIARLTSAPVVGPARISSSTPEALALHRDAGELQQIRRLRGEVMQGVIGDRAVIAVSGITSGRSTIQAATALGASFAAAGLVTLVIDADAQGDLSRSLHGRADRGIVDVLASPGMFNEALVRGPGEHLWYLPGSTAPGYQDDLLNSPSMTGLLESATRQFSAVVMNLPSVEDVPVPSVVAGAANGAVLVCQIDHDTASSLSRATASLERGRVRLLTTLALAPAAPSVERARAAHLTSTTLATA